MSTYYQHTLHDSYTGYLYIANKIKTLRSSWKVTIEINIELDKVNTWLKVNKLSLNVEKTKCMLFHKRRQLNPIKFSINDRDIDVVSHFNYLWIILDENISWKKHVAMITNKLSKISGVLHRLK